MRFDRKKFYVLFRVWFKKTHGTNLSQATVDGLNFVLDCIENDPEWKDVRQVANFLAQTGHESAWIWKPIKEKRGRVGTKHRAIQDRYWNTGYYGRGIIQLTWKTNYETFAKLLKVALVANPDLALDPRISYLIAAIGMRKGLFTGKKLSDYIKPGKVPDYKGARKIVNGTDRDTDIANYSVGIETVLKGSILLESSSSSAVIKVEPEETKEPLIKTEAHTEPEHIPETLPTTDPYDDYPDEPKPGEAAPDNPAKPGEPIAGGRTTDESVSIPANEAIKPRGWHLWKTTIAGWIATLGVSAGSIGTYISGAIENPTIGRILIILGGIAFLGSIVVGVTYLIIRAVLLIKREKQAHELTLRQLEIRANPALYNIKVDSQENIDALFTVSKTERENLVSFR